MELTSYTSTYIPYTQLDSFPSDTNYLLLLREVSNGIINSNSISIREQLSVILQLRRMRKHQRGLFEVCFDNIISVFVDHFIIQQADSSLVLCHSLLFAKEIFTNFYQDLNESWLIILYPPIEDVVFCCANEQMSQLARDVIQSFAVNMKYTITISVLFNSIENVNGCKLREKFLYETFDLFFRTVDVTYLQLGFDWNEIVQGLHCNSKGNANANVVNGNSNCIGNGVQSVLILLKKYLNLNDSWANFLSMLEEDNRTIVNKLLINNI